MARIVKQPAQRREEIVEAAEELFLVKGFERTTMRDVMQRLQVAKGTIYHYFQSKEELLDAVVEHIVEVDLNDKRKVVDRASGGSLERIRALVKSSVKDHPDHQEIIERLHQPANAGMHIRLLARMIQLQAPLYAGLIEQGCREGLFSTDSPLESAEFILAGVQFLTDRGVYSWAAADLERRVRALPGLIEIQLGAPAGSFNFLAEMFT